MNERAQYKIYIEENGEKILICPQCGDGFLHQTKTVIFDRFEDEVEGLRVTTNRDNTVNIKKTLEGNPSKRRDGLKVHFFCEICHKDSVLDIYQHKGQTFIKFYEKK